MDLFEKIKRVRRRFQADEFIDPKIRARFLDDYNIKVGMYSYGCFDRNRIDPNTTIGRYCSFSTTAVVLNRNHGVDFLGTTPYLYNSNLGLVESDAFDYDACEIGDDVWLGHNAAITASARRVGRGAVIAAGAVVTKDVAPYTIVAGVPARPVRLRFDDRVIWEIEASRWWEWDLAELRRQMTTEPTMIFAPAKHFAAAGHR